MVTFPVDVVKLSGLIVMKGISHVNWERTVLSDRSDAARNSSLLEAYPWQLPWGCVGSCQKLRKM